MTAASLQVENLTFVYESAQEPLFDGICLRLGAGWTGVVGENGSGKTTLLRLIGGELIPSRGRVLVPGQVIYCPQRTDDPPAELDALLWAAEGGACALRGRLGIEPDWLDRWATLSHGERKRAQIAVALWQRPQALLIDEPTNHIDRAAKLLLSQALRSFRGVGLLVSHDRELLDELCSQCLFVEPPSIVLRAGGYSRATQLAQEERERLLREKEQAKEELTRLRRERADRARAAAAEHKARSKSGLAPRDFDTRAKINLARLTDSKAGASLRQLDGRLDQAQAKLAGLFVRKQHRAAMQIAGRHSGRNELFRIEEGSIELGGGRVLTHPDLAMVPEDRVALVGANGGGKSTLLRHILPHLPLPPDKLVYLAQEIHREQAVHIVEQVRKLGDHQLGQVMAMIGALGSRPDRLLQTELPSPGELRKLLLALGMMREPELIIMDEPTNHLDLPSIECMESALAECGCALLLVSHDERFLSKLTSLRWEIEPDADDPVASRLVIRRPPAGQNT